MSPLPLPPADGPAGARHFAAYRNASPHARHLLAVLALEAEAVPRRQVEQIAGHPLLATVRRTLGGPTVHRGVLQELTAAGLAQESSANHWRIASAVLETALAAAIVREPAARPYLDVWRTLASSSSPREYYCSFGPDSVRMTRLAYFAGDRAELLKRLGRDMYSIPHFFFRNFDADLIARLPDDTRLSIVDRLTRACLRNWIDAGPLLRWLDREPKPLSFPGASDDHTAADRFDLRLLRGDWAEIAALLEAAPADAAVPWQATLALLRGELDAACAGFDQAHTALRAAQRRKNLCLPGLPGLFSIVAPALRLAAGDLAKAETRCAMAGKASNRYAREAGLLSHLLAAMATTETPRPDWYGTDARQHFLRPLSRSNGMPNDLGHFDPGYQPASDLEAFIQLLGVRQLDIPDQNRKAFAVDARAAAGQAYAAGCSWAEAELLAWLDRPAAFFQAGPVVALSVRFRPREEWETRLQALESVSSSVEAVDAPAAASARSRRLIWMVTDDPDGAMEDDDFLDDDVAPEVPASALAIRPVLQTANRTGRFTGGRPVSAERLGKGEWPTEATEQDRRMLGAWVARRTDTWSPYPRTRSAFHSRVWKEAVGHPLVFRAADEVHPVEIVTGTPRLVCREHPGGGLLIALDPPLPIAAGEQGDSCAVLERGGQLLVIPITDRLRRLAKLLRTALVLPDTARDRATRALSGLAHAAMVESQVDLPDVPATDVPARPEPVVRLTPTPDGMEAAFVVRPFGAEGPAFPPGEGTECVLIQAGGRRLRARRPLAEERDRATQLRAQCAMLLDEAEVASFRFQLASFEDALDLLVQLRAAAATIPHAVEYPKGDPLRVHREVRAKDLALTVSAAGEWLGLQGVARVDEDLVLSLQELIRLAREQGTKRFVRLDNGAYVALERRLRQQLADLDCIAETHRGAMRMNPLAALALAPLLEEATGSGLAGWQELRQRMEEAAAWTPDAPTALEAELRPYQLDGYRWLARLARVGAGACLADDMGLGKTVQALAVMLDRAAAGPALVLAPTSVCGNWLDEARRFAPTLQVTLLGEGDRAQAVAALGPRDVLVVSYGLLARELETLQTVRFETIVLDEAQAIKNASAKRTRAALELRGGFRMIATGTPVENHPGELWPLFQFLNPGLLGSVDRFRERFVTPMEGPRAAEVRARLKRLIAPFVLRRRKSEVLDDLPSRTEITLAVELPAEERALYEGIRREALLALASGDEPAERKRFRVLAEIMRLRRACCHPSLILPETPLPGAKLEQFAETAAELRENGHRALVFSQFTSHLAILRARLDALGLTYRYLDGSTPAARRREEVEAFQDGHGDFFLISLRAGGFGLNLTAADYVIHMDPWWNPAVEDQASDRAHRIGQTRPVTIYRLIVKDSIEEKILALHARKRDMADELLAGADGSARLSIDDLVALLR